MSTETAPRATSGSLTTGQLPRHFGISCAVVSIVIAAVILWLAHAMGPIQLFFIALILDLLTTRILGGIVEGGRRTKDRIMETLVVTCFILAMAPLISLLVDTISQGAHRFDGEFFNSSMRNVVGEGGGAVHAIYGTLIVTGITALISIPIGIMCAIYLVEYGNRNKLARAITFFVDVMTGIPSIVAGLFAFALMSLAWGPGAAKTSFTGSIALSILMIPTIVRSTEEYLRIVPMDLREASYALGVSKWRTIWHVVLPTALAGIVTGVILAIARVIGETAPLLVAIGATDSVNVNPFSGSMASLPVFVYYSVTQPGIPASYSEARAWTGALVLILIVMLLNGIGRWIAAKFAPKSGR